MLVCSIIITCFRTAKLHIYFDITYICPDFSMKYFSSRRCEIFLARIFVLRRDVVISASGGNFEAVYYLEIDGIPSRS